MSPSNQTLLFPAESGTTSAIAEADFYEEELDIQSPVAAQRAPVKPICPPSELAIIEGFTLLEIANVIAMHIDTHDQETYADWKNPTRRLINLYLRDKNAKAFYLGGRPTRYVERINDPTYRDVTIEQLIVDQFNRLSYIAKDMENQEGGRGYRAEFINFAFPINNGVAKVRAFAYNPGGFIVSEFRGYKKIANLTTNFGPARHSYSKDELGLNKAKDTRISGSPQVSNRISGTPGTPATTGNTGITETAQTTRINNDLGVRRQPGKL